MKNIDLENAKENYKTTIQELINSNNIKEAKYMIDEYEKRVHNDFDIYSIKSVIYILEGKLFAAENIINDGLKINNKSFDLIYNKAYVNMLKNESKEAIKYYNIALRFAISEEVADEIKNTINKLKNIKTKKEKKEKIVIGSPIHQKPNILKEFLISLQEMNTEEFEVSYIFVDDNENDESRKILEEFSDKFKNVVIYKNNETSLFNCDDNTHYWNERLIKKVAYFKDRIIDNAITLNYDYLFLVDSDMVLHPETLNQLVAAKKDIISNIFWTKWEKDKMVLPQVWVSGQYNQFFKQREEVISNEEMYNRQAKFINMLKTPGIYEVGGLCACTLVSKKALRSGVNFKEIKSLPYIGEDRHFCVRAQALGFNLYVDTHYPAYHIYREDDLKGVEKFKERCSRGEYCLKKNICLICENFSGSNTIALFKLMPQYIKDKYNIYIIKQVICDEYFDTIMKSDLVILTEGNYPFLKKTFNSKQKVIDLWHGFPLKSICDKKEALNDSKNVWDNVDYVASYSELFNCNMSKCIPVKQDKYIITGAPRNDFLYISDGKKNLENILGDLVKGKKVIFYMPTYRKNVFRDNHVEGNKNWNNIFGFKNLNEKGFNEFLKENNLVLVLKLHPAEEGETKQYIRQSPNIILLEERLLKINGIDLYELLNSADLLMTDYSSVYFDYLLLDRPIIFIPNDLKEYDRDRGFLLKPYDKWTPGPKVLDQYSLEQEILKGLKDNSYYQKERKEILGLVHKNMDGNSSERVWKFVDDII